MKIRCDLRSVLPTPQTDWEKERKPLANAIEPTQQVTLPPIYRSADTGLRKSQASRLIQDANGQRLCLFAPLR